MSPNACDSGSGTIERVIPGTYAAWCDAAEQNDSDYLRVRVLMGKSLFKKAIELGTESIHKMPNDGASSGLAFRIAAAVSGGSTIGRESFVGANVLAARTGEEVRIAAARDVHAAGQRKRRSVRQIALLAVDDEAR